MKQSIGATFVIPVVVNDETHIFKYAVTVIVDTSNMASPVVIKDAQGQQLYPSGT